jgi:hypothetical protein
MHDATVDLSNSFACTSLYACTVGTYEARGKSTAIAGSIPVHEEYCMLMQSSFDVSYALTLSRAERVHTSVLTWCDYACTAALFMSID